MSRWRDLMLHGFGSSVPADPGPSVRELKAAGEVGRALEPLSQKQRAEVLEKLNAKYRVDGLGRATRAENIAAYRRAVEREVERLQSNPATAVGTLATNLEPGLLEAARAWQAPSGKPRTAANMDLLSMNVARFALVTAKLMDEHRPKEMTDDDALGAHEIVARKYPVVHRVMDAVSDFYLLFVDDDMESRISQFHEDWSQHAAFARLEIGHKLAAALCLTDVPDDVEVQAPWPAWSLVIPDGLFPESDAAHGRRNVARLWCIGTQPAFGVTREGGLIEVDRFKTEEGDRVFASLRNLIRGACLALSNPDDFRKQRQGGDTGRTAAARRENKAPPDLAQARFLLSAPVQIDLREHLRDVLSGRKGASPTVQFLVRGHWRNQACGPRLSLRKTIWIQPFWKGEEGARVLLRQHAVEAPKDKS